MGCWIYTPSISLIAKLWPRFKINRWPTYRVMTTYSMIQICRFSKIVANCVRWPTQWVANFAGCMVHKLRASNTFNIITDTWWNRADWCGSNDAFWRGAVRYRSRQWLLSFFTIFISPSMQAPGLVRRLEQDHLFQNTFKCIIHQEHSHWRHDV
jgi:hypothetical protein